MKCMICAVLAACSAIAVAGEPKHGAAPPATNAPPAADQAQAPAAPGNALPPGVMVSPDGTVLLAPDSLLPKQGSVLHFHGHLRFSSTCYFIRTLRPLQAPEKSSHPHFVPLQSLRLQATVTGNVYGPDCTSGGELIPVPVTRTRPAPSADEASP